MDNTLKFELAQVYQAAMELQHLGETAGFNVAPIYDGEQMDLDAALKRLETVQDCFLSAKAVVDKFSRQSLADLAERLKAEYK